MAKKEGERERERRPHCQKLRKGIRSIIAFFAGRKKEGAVRGERKTKAEGGKVDRNLIEASTEGRVEYLKFHEMK